MIRNRRIGTVLLAAVVAVAAGCTEGSSASESASTAAAAPAQGAGGQMRVDMDAIFPAGEGRDILLNNCQSCHTWVPVVVLQMNEDEWYRWSLEHRQRVENLSDEQFQTLYNYLVANFNPNRPVPELPPALLESWTTY